MIHSVSESSLEVNSKALIINGEEEYIEISRPFLHFLLLVWGFGSESELDFQFESSSEFPLSLKGLLKLMRSCVHF